MKQFWKPDLCFRKRRTVRNADLCYWYPNGCQCLSCEGINGT